MAPFFVAAGLVGAAVCYWLFYYDALYRGEMATTPEERLLALIILPAMLVVGALLWPRSRQRIPLLDYIVPGTMFCLGWLGVWLLAYHCRMGMRLAERQGVEPPAYCREGQAYGALSGLLGLLYVVAYRWYPPEPLPKEPPKTWHRFIQHTLLLDIVHWLER